MKKEHVGGRGREGGRKEDNCKAGRLTILRRGRDDDLLGPSLQVEAGLLGRGEDTGGLADVVRPCLPPPDLRGILGLVDLVGRNIEGGREGGREDG